MPHNRFDTGGWTKQQCSVTVSWKTSLRERWKQAGMEGRLLKEIFPKTETYLTTNNSTKAQAQRRRIEDGTLHGIDGVYVAHEKGFDGFVKYLQGLDLIIYDQITPMTGTLA